MLQLKKKKLFILKESISTSSYFLTLRWPLTFSGGFPVKYKMGMEQAVHGIKEVSFDK